MLRGGGVKNLISFATGYKISYLQPWQTGRSGCLVIRDAPIFFSVQIQCWYLEFGYLQIPILNWYQSSTTAIGIMPYVILGQNLHSVHCVNWCWRTVFGFTCSQKSLYFSLRQFYLRRDPGFETENTENNFYLSLLSLPTFICSNLYSLTYITATTAGAEIITPENRTKWWGREKWLLFTKSCQIMRSLLKHCQ